MPAAFPGPFDILFPARGTGRDTTFPSSTALCLRGGGTLPDSHHCSGFPQAGPANPASYPRPGIPQGTGQRDNLCGPGTDRTELQPPRSSHTTWASRRGSLTLSLPTRPVAIRPTLLISAHGVAEEIERDRVCASVLRTINPSISFHNEEGIDTVAIRR